MKLAEFIVAHLDEIIAEGESFVRAFFTAAEDMSQTELRDHARQVLMAVAQDIKMDQTPVQQQNASGMAAGSEGSATSVHGTLRRDRGFTLPQFIVEFPALRTAVLRLWLPQVTTMTEEVMDDMLRFNEAIDRALVDSVITCSKQAAVVRDTFLAILAHDLRSPLATVMVAGGLLTQPTIGTDGSRQIGQNVKRSAATMTAIINDLLEFARSQLSSKIPIIRSQVDIKEICQAALDDVKGAHPDCLFELVASGDWLGHFDGPRLYQVFANLLNNAAQYRGKEHPVIASIEGQPDIIVVKVKNFGPVIPPERLKTVFEPFVQLPVAEAHLGRPSTSLGLGLFIAREITEAHGGSISAKSGEDTGTMFSVQLPRRNGDC